MSNKRTKSSSTIQELTGASGTFLDDMFFSGEVPVFKEFSGRTRGAFVHWNSLNPWWITAVVRIFFNSPAGRWTGKELSAPFDADRIGTGINLFNNSIQPRRFRFDTYVKERSLYDQAPCLVLDYRPYFSVMGGLVDEVRKVRDGVLLGRMYYNFPWQERPWFTGYFVLCATGR